MGGRSGGRCQTIIKPRSAIHQTTRAEADKSRFHKQASVMDDFVIRDAI